MPQIYNGNKILRPTKPDEEKPAGQGPPPGSLLFYDTDSGSQFVWTNTVDLQISPAGGSTVFDCVNTLAGIFTSQQDENAGWTCDEYRWVVSKV
jgi:hypothetical protein